MSDQTRTKPVGLMAPWQVSAPRSPPTFVVVEPYGRFVSRSGGDGDDASLDTSAYCVVVEAVDTMSPLGIDR